jgi:hypothetical protein
MSIPGYWSNNVFAWEDYTYQFIATPMPCGCEGYELVESPAPQAWCDETPDQNAPPADEVRVPLTTEYFL